MHIHILGIGGTFMAGVAQLASALGHRVTGSDQALYPPMSTQLEALGCEISDGYSAASLEPRPDLVVVGNAITRGNEAFEYVLNEQLDYMSGPAWLERYALPGRHVIAIAGTHGKTTVSSLVSWMLERAGLNPAFLVGGLVENFGVSARLTDSRFFVIEADEYDTALFDKRSKFLRYHPRTLVINNLEYDHADIFPDLAAIQTQFHHLVRTLPSRASIICPDPSPSIDEVLAMGCWSSVQRFGRNPQCHWRLEWPPANAGSVAIQAPDNSRHQATTGLLGEHNAWNITAAAAAACDVGVEPAVALAALSDFKNVRRRLEIRGEIGGVTVYDDFAHHPTAISATIDALRSNLHSGKLHALLEPRSNTMAMGIHKNTLAASLAKADTVHILLPDDLKWDIRAAFEDDPRVRCYTDVTSLVRQVVNACAAGDAVLAMSNGAFGDVHNKLLNALEAAR